MAPNGSIPHYAYRNYNTGASAYTMVDVAKFATTITLMNFHRGRSAAWFVFQGVHDPYHKDPPTYSVFMVDLVEMIKDPRWQAGVITADFEPCKRGSNYGIRLVVPVVAP